MTIRRIITMSGTILQYNRSAPIIINNFQLLNQPRFTTITRLKHTKALRSEKEKIRTYFVQRYIDYVKNYTKVLETRFPNAVKMYRVFSVGIKDFLRDLKMYITLRIKVARDHGFSKMSRQEIELYTKMPSDMLRIAPVLILSAIPFGNYIIFPLAFLKPRTLLCSHFWSIQQKVEFSRQELTERLRHNKPVFRSLQAQVEIIPDGDIKLKWKRVIASLGSGVHPSPKDVLACKDLFTKEPYQLSSLNYAHLGHLLKMHGLRKSIFRTSKLKYRAFLLLEMDKAIIREGGVNILNAETLRNACHMRGLNGSNLPNQDMRNWLQNWLSVSENIDRTSYSLLLHCPIFFAYNHPQNWVLIY
ncbi:LETM1 domain-containing protein 1 [Bombyx mori]|uniref:Letm1 RBD domain-containing protein n=1 Tax=Bombyx mori TaxID=7091 RepID=A0A8R1WLW0_BOMMO|nr:LETM1 domain-containing protein 1 [Bombyx mori]